MNRIGFIKSFIGLLGLSSIPLELIRQYDKIYLLQCFVRGFKYYKGPSLLDEMHIGDMLELRRERENEHDTFAIALYFNNFKIGFIPTESNEILSKLLDANVLEFLAEITHLEKAAATWENVRVVIYVLKEVTGDLPQPESNLNQLETPEYFTIKHNGEKVSRFAWKDVGDHTIKSAEDQLKQRNVILDFKI